MQGGKCRACYCPGIVVKSASSSSTSFPQHSSGTSPSPATISSDDAHAQASEVRGDPPKRKKDNIRATRDRLRDLPEWLEAFTENLEDTEVPALAHTSHDSDSER